VAPLEAATPVVAAAARCHNLSGALRRFTRGKAGGTLLVRVWSCSFDDDDQRAGYSKEYVLPQRPDGASTADRRRLARPSEHLLRIDARSGSAACLRTPCTLLRLYHLKAALNWVRHARRTFFTHSFNSGGVAHGELRALSS
jgi:hypothetical protein